MTFQTIRLYAIATCARSNITWPHSLMFQRIIHQLYAICRLTYVAKILLIFPMIRCNVPSKKIRKIAITMIMICCPIYVFVKFSSKFWIKYVFNSEFEINNFLSYSFKDNLIVQWYVTALFEDIADFYITIRDSNNDLLAERRLSYDDRVVQISGSDISDDYVGQLELCALAKNSNGDIRTWFDSQCIYLPDNFDAIKRQYGQSRNQPFIIHSIKKRIRANTVASENGKKKIRRKSSRSSGIRDTATATFIYISLVIAYFSSYCV